MVDHIRLLTWAMLVAFFRMGGTSAGSTRAKGEKPLKTLHPGRAGPPNTQVRVPKLTLEFDELYIPTISGGPGRVSKAAMRKILEEEGLFQPKDGWSPFILDLKLKSAIYKHYKSLRERLPETPEGQMATDVEN